MEIAPVPRRRRLSAAGRTLVVAAFLTPLTLLTLLPVMLGLDRYVVAGDDMGGALGRGALVYTHPVPVGDLAVGDVITFTPPRAKAGTRVTRRVIELDGLGARTRGDARSAPDPWTLPLEQPVESKVVLAVPWVGYPLLAPASRTAGVLAAFGVAGALVLLVRVRGMSRVRP